MISKFVFAALSVAVASVAASDVVILTDATFDAWIVANPSLSLIEFYAPWCGHCKSLAPEYELAATALKREISLAKVDCTTEKVVCDKLGIQGFPTLKMFREGKDSEYKGPRVADGIVPFMPAPALTQLNESTFEAFSHSDEVVVIGTFTDIESKAFLVFRDAAERLRDKHSFGYLIGDVQKVSLYKKFDSKYAEYTDEIWEGGLSVFISKESVPLVAEIGPDNYSMYIERALPICYFFYENEPQKTQYTAAVTAVAEQFIGKVSVVWIDAVKYAGHGQSMNLMVYPGFVVSGKEGSKFPFMGELGEKGMMAHVAGVLDGSVVASLKSAEVPVPNDEPVVVAVGTTFLDIVGNTAKDVFIELYAPWCGHCKKLTPIWETLAKKLAGEKIVIAKMDMTENDLPLGVGYTVDGFPTLKLYKAGGEIVEYKGDRSLADLVVFLRENAVHGAGIKEGLELEAADAEEDEKHSDEL